MKYIQGRDDWEFAGIYSDEGITGTCMAKREGFTRMVDDALAGGIDLILTKSVSRFARNTVDSLTTIRKLPELITEFDESLWAGLVDSMTVHSKDKIMFRLTCGVEIES